MKITNTAKTFLVATSALSILFSLTEVFGAGGSVQLTGNNDGAVLAQSETRGDRFKKNKLLLADKLGAVLAKRTVILDSSIDPFSNQIESVILHDVKTQRTAQSPQEQDAHKANIQRLQKQKEALIANLPEAKQREFKAQEAAEVAEAAKAARFKIMPQAVIDELKTVIASRTTKIDTEEKIAARLSRVAKKNTEIDQTVISEIVTAQIEKDAKAAVEVDGALSRIGDREYLESLAPKPANASAELLVAPHPDHEKAYGKTLAAVIETHIEHICKANYSPARNKGNMVSLPSYSQDLDASDLANQAIQNNFVKQLISVVERQNQVDSINSIESATKLRLFQGLESPQSINIEELGKAQAFYANLQAVVDTELDSLTEKLKDIMLEERHTKGGVVQTTELSFAEMQAKYPTFSLTSELKKSLAEKLPQIEVRLKSAAKELDWIEKDKEEKLAAQKQELQTLRADIQKLIDLQESGVTTAVAAPVVEVANVLEVADAGTNQALPMLTRAEAPAAEVMIVVAAHAVEVAPVEVIAVEAAPAASEIAIEVADAAANLALHTLTPSQTEAPAPIVEVANVEVVPVVEAPAAIVEAPAPVVEAPALVETPVVMTVESERQRQLNTELDNLNPQSLLSTIEQHDTAGINFRDQASTQDISDNDAIVGQSAEENSITSDSMNLLAIHGFDEIISKTINNKMLAESFSSSDSNVAAGDDDLDRKGIKSLWVKGLYGKSKQASSGTKSGYKGEAFGVTIGLDFNLGEDSMVGIAYSNLNSKFKFNKNQIGDKVLANTHTLSMYGQTTINDKIILQGMISGLTSKVTTKAAKLIGVNTYRTATGKHNAIGFNAETLVSYKMSTNSGFTFLPSIGLKYGFNSEGAYSETGSGIYDMSITARKYETLTGSLGFKALIPYKLSNYTEITPSLHGSVEDTLMQREQSVIANLNYLGRQFSHEIKLNRKSKIGYNIGGGLDIKHKNIEILTTYNYHTKKNYQSHQGSIKLNILF